MCMKIRNVGLGILLVVTFGVLPVFAQRKAEETLLVTVILNDKYNSDFKVCMALSEKSPVEVGWGKDPLRQSLSVVLEGKSEKGYILLVTNRVFEEGRQVASSLDGFTLKLDDPVTSSLVVSSAFRDYRGKTVMVSTKSCASNEPKPRSILSKPVK